MSDHSLGGGFGENVRNDVQPQAEEIKKKERSKRKAGERLNTARWRGEGEDEEGRGRKKRGEWMRRKEEFRNSSGGAKEEGRGRPREGGRGPKHRLLRVRRAEGRKAGLEGEKQRQQSAAVPSPLSGHALPLPVTTSHPPLLSVNRHVVPVDHKRGMRDTDQTTKLPRRW